MKFLMPHNACRRIPVHTFLKPSMDQCFNEVSSSSQVIRAADHGNIFFPPLSLHYFILFYLFFFFPLSVFTWLGFVLLLLSLPLYFQANQSHEYMTIFDRSFSYLLFPSWFR
ncbi:hypothetical protein BDV26DRAFT_91770 [Aspergillus bertholletiae]|uniref:Uncharacterized protein n=1 Tax=Aspergillus bertholletiae TaxID=1226010 RepID=A0A5N7BP01_9EURO|nr:hypothetical protein BDV26DRAFT_91770 [Aspergillus bertholletiae]